MSKRKSNDLIASQEEEKCYTDDHKFPPRPKTDDIRRVNGTKGHRKRTQNPGRQGHCQLLYVLILGCCDLSETASSPRNVRGMKKALSIHATELFREQWARGLYTSAMFSQDIKEAFTRLRGKRTFRSDVFRYFEMWITETRGRQPLVFPIPNKTHGDCVPASVIELADKFEMEVPAEARERMGENQVDEAWTSGELLDDDEGVDQPNEDLSSVRLASGSLNSNARHLKQDVQVSSPIKSKTTAQSPSSLKRKSTEVSGEDAKLEVKSKPKKLKIIKNKSEEKINNPTEKLVFESDELFDADGSVRKDSDGEEEQEDGDSQQEGSVDDAEGHKGANESEAVELKAPNPVKSSKPAKEVSRKIKRTVSVPMKAAAATEEEEEEEEEEEDQTAQASKSMKRTFSVPIVQESGKESKEAKAGKKMGKKQAATEEEEEEEEEEEGEEDQTAQASKSMKRTKSFSVRSVQESGKASKEAKAGKNMKKKGRGMIPPSPWH